MQTLKRVEGFAELMLLAKKKRTIGPLKPIWNRDEKGQTFVDLDEVEADNRVQAEKRALKLHGGDLDIRLNMGGFPIHKREQYVQMQADSMDSYFNEALEKGGWLYLYGPTGIGKTLWSSSLGAGWLKRDIINEAAFISLAEWLQGERDKYNGDRLKLPAIKPVTILDDFGVFKASEWVFEQLFRLFDGLYRSKKVVVVTSMFEPEKVLDRCKLSLMSNRWGGGVDTALMEAVISRVRRKARLIPFLKDHKR